MLYMLLCSAVLFTVFIGTVARVMREALSTEQGKRRYLPLFELASYAVGMAYCAPLLHTFFAPAGTPEEILGIDSGRLTVYLLLASSVAMLFYIPSLWKKAADSKRFWPMGQLTLIALACFVGGKSAYDHLTFFSTKQAGWANFVLLKKIGEITDMPGCTSPIAFVRYQSTGPFEYRCPGLIVFNQQSSQPFAPWPHNDNGSSQQLANLILKMKRDAGAPQNVGDEPTL